MLAKTLFISTPKITDCALWPKRTWRELLRSISPQLNLPEQTACICVECLDTIKQKYQQVILLVERYGTFVLAAAKMAPAIITS